MRAVIIKVKGDVQGVFYRHHTKTEAQKLGISGWVKNEHDGSVTIFAQGENNAVTNLIEWAKEGSPMATVENLQVSDSKLIEGLEGFTTK